MQQPNSRRGAERGNGLDVSDEFRAGIAVEVFAYLNSQCRFGEGHLNNRLVQLVHLTNDVALRKLDLEDQDDVVELHDEISLAVAETVRIVELKPKARSDLGPVVGEPVANLSLIANPLCADAPRRRTEVLCPRRRLGQCLR